MILAWLLLLTGLTISAVAIYYSVVGLTAIFAAAAVPIIIMGTTLEVAKLVCASWLKQNWTLVPRLMKTYMTTAVVVLMLITSMGIFGFLSKAHLDQSLVSGDVTSQIAIFDEKIKTEKENIEAARKALSQMDAAVDQTMSRSTSEQGADKAASLRRSQAKERASLQKEITTAQSNVAKLQQERAPIAAEVRKVEAEVGPIKYIAALLYGDNPDQNILEKAVTWVIVTIVIVFDPLAVIMLLAAQMSFGWRNGKEQLEEESTVSDWFTRAKDRAKFWDNQIKEKAITILPTANKFWPFPAKPETHNIEEVIGEEPLEEAEIEEPKIDEVVVENTTESELDKWNKMIEEAERAVAVEAELQRGEELLEAEAKVKPEDSKKKTYMTKDQAGHIQIKNRE